MADQYISVREAAIALGVTEKKIMDFVASGALPAYRIAGQFVRLKHKEVMALKDSEEIPVENIQFDYNPGEKIRDFFYFNDFYLASFVIMLALLYYIFSA